MFKKIYGDKKLPEDDQSFLTNTLSGLTTLACISIGFSYAIAIENYNQAFTDLVNEKIQIESLDKLLKIDGSPEALMAKQYLSQYAGSIVTDEWSQLLKGKTSPVTTNLSEKFEERIDKINPVTPRQISIFNAIIAAAEKVQSARLQRILNSTLSIPIIFILLSDFLFFLIILISGSLMAQSSHVQKFALTLQCFIFALFLAGIVILDYPYIGPSSISPDSLIFTMEAVQGSDNK